MNGKILSRMVLFVFSALLGVSFTSASFAIQPEVRNVTVYKVGGSVYLNVTVYHFPEDASIPHYVDIIEVIMGANTTDLAIGVQPLTANNTFTVPYDLGPVPGTPSITVKAHCLVNGWSAANWTGTVPEFPLPALLLALIFTIFLAVLVFRKIR